ncbi:MAG: hypothetical protein EXR02_09530 [Rhodospirillales bacterium]|nr:hypothetical protein [Rhodospirillales bacterium]
MPNTYTYAWTPDGYKGKKEGDPVDYSGGSDFEKLRQDDRLFVLTLKNGTVYLLGAMTVGEVVDTATAKRLRGRVYAGKSQHVLAKQGTASGFAFRPVPNERLGEFRFIARNGENGVKLKDGRPNPQTLRRLRRVTDQTATDLELLLARSGMVPPASVEANKLRLLTDANAVNAAMAEFKKLGRTPFLKKYGYEKSTRYQIFDGRDHFDSKAIAGAAVGYQHPERGPLKHNEFSGGEATVVKKLEALGFKVIEQGPGIDWTPEENAAIVAAYFDMLGIVARGEKLNKAAHNAALRENLQRRTRGSIERK